MSGVFDRFPGLRFVLTEQGALDPVDAAPARRLPTRRWRRPGASASCGSTSTTCCRVGERVLRPELLGRRQLPVARRGGGVADDRPRPVHVGQRLPAQGGHRTRTRSRVSGARSRPTPEADLRRILAGNIAGVYGFDLDAPAPFAARRGRRRRGGRPARRDPHDSVSPRSHAVAPREPVPPTRLWRGPLHGPTHPTPVSSCSPPHRACSAREGIYQVPLKRIVEQAGQRNAVALHYHFGGREGLLHAIILRYDDRIQAERHEMLTEIEASGDPAISARWSKRCVVPFARCLATEDGREYLRIVSQLSALLRLLGHQAADGSDRDAADVRVDGRLPAAADRPAPLTSASRRCWVWSAKRWPCLPGRSTARTPAGPCSTTPSSSSTSSTCRSARASAPVTDVIAVSPSPLSPPVATVPPVAVVAD